MNDFLPIGSVIKLEENAPAAIMIAGYYPIDKNSGQKFDYLGFVYPEGLNNSMNSILFNSEDIELVLYKGYSDETRELFMNKISGKDAEQNE